MLLEIARWLSDDLRALSVLEYITLRAVFACATALLIGLVAGPRVIRKLTEMKIGQAVRAYGPESHLVKNGTPTMGGVLILISRAISTLLWADWTNRFVWVVLLVTLAGLYGVGIYWVRQQARVVTLTRRRVGTILVAGDQLEEAFVITNPSFFPLLWAAFPE